MQESDWMLERYQRLVRTVAAEAYVSRWVSGAEAAAFSSMNWRRRRSWWPWISVTSAYRDAVDDYLELRGFESSLRLFYGVNQADVDRLRQIARAEFPEGELDLVIDDRVPAFSTESRASFDAVSLPWCVRAGSMSLKTGPGHTATSISPSRKMRRLSAAGSGSLSPS